MPSTFVMLRHLLLCCVLLAFCVVLPYGCASQAPGKGESGQSQGDGGTASDASSLVDVLSPEDGPVDGSGSSEATSGTEQAPDAGQDGATVPDATGADATKPEGTGPEPQGPCTLPTSEPETRVQQWIETKLDQGLKAHTHAGCQVKAFRLVAAAGVEFKVEVQGISSFANLKLEILNARRAYQVAPQDPPLGRGSTNFKDWISTSAVVDSSGEIAVLLHGNLKPTSYQIQFICTRNCTLQATRFPIVLLHGFFGTDKYLNILDYFYKVVPHLKDKGYGVTATKVPPIENSSKRILQLKPQIDEIFKRTGARKLNLIGHSQGGIDGRLFIHTLKYGDRIASLTTISTPHRGVPLPDLLIPPSRELGEKNMEQYNKQYPNDPRVKYFSWAGVSCAPLDSACRKKYNDEVIDPLFLALYHTLKRMRGPNDGIVTVDSAKWGTFLGEIPADHLDEVGQIADSNNKPFNHKQFFLSEAQRLQKLDF